MFISITVWNKDNKIRVNCEIWNQIKLTNRTHFHWVDLTVCDDSRVLSMLSCIPSIHATWYQTEVDTGKPFGRTAIQSADLSESLRPLILPLVGGGALRRDACHRRQWIVWECWLFGVIIFYEKGKKGEK